MTNIENLSAHDQYVYMLDLEDGSSFIDGLTHYEDDEDHNPETCEACAALAS